jgi:DnaJ-class molecular chaperone
MILKNYYAVLGLSRDTSSEEIKRAFRQLASRYHPDHNPGNIEEAEAKFKEINEAYEILSDRLKRWQYDQLTGLTGSVQSAINDEEMDNPEIVSLQEMLYWLAKMGIVSSRGYGSGRGCQRRHFWQCRRQQWRE